MSITNIGLIMRLVKNDDDSAESPTEANCTLNKAVLISK